MYPPLTVPEPAPVAHDPVAVALANASLLGVGYLMLRRPVLAILTGLVTVGLVALHGSVTRSVWLEGVILLWWAALIAHGWLLARRRTRRVAVRQRFVALGVTIPVLLAVAFLRFDAGRIERSVTEAQQSGDCAAASTALDRVWLGHRLADAPLTVRGDRTVQACQRIEAAGDRLTTGLTGDTDALRAGFEGLAAVLAELPGHERMVDVVLDGSSAACPPRTPATPSRSPTWLRQRQPTGNALDRSAGVVPRTAPAALVGCADGLMTAKDWEQARTLYQQLLDQYPGHGLTAKAQEGIKRATLAIELANVRDLIQKADYCDRPAPYSGAAPYGKGINRSLFIGDKEYPNRLPAAWVTADAAEAVLVVCAGLPNPGTPARTCPYENQTSPRFITDVTFRKIAIAVKAFELRTGKLVLDTKVEIGGASCPPTIEYTVLSGLPDHGPPSEQDVNPSDTDVHAAFAALITP